MPRKPTRVIPGTVAEAETALRDRLGENAKPFNAFCRLGMEVSEHLYVLNTVVPHVERFLEKTRRIDHDTARRSSFSRLSEGFLAFGEEPFLRTIGDVVERLSLFRLERNAIRRWREDIEKLTAEISPVLKFLPAKRDTRVCQFMAGAAIWWAKKASVPLEPRDFVYAEIAVLQAPPFRRPPPEDRDAEEHALAGVEFKKRLNRWVQTLKAAQPLVRLLLAQNPAPILKPWRWDDDADLYMADGVTPRPKRPPGNG